jgi:transcriptional regulator with XRE-family HTH domain
MTPEEIKALRDRFQMSQSEFATKLGMTKRGLQNWEADPASPEHRKPRGVALTLLGIMAELADERDARRAKDRAKRGAADQVEGPAEVEAPRKGPGRPRVYGAKPADAGDVQPSADATEGKPGRKAKGKRKGGAQ